MAEQSLMKLAAVAVVAALLTAGGMTVFGGAGAGESETEIMITGSTTLFPIMTVFQEQYEKETVGVSLSISGGGSGIGINNAAAGTADIGMSSRDVRDSEKDANPDLKVHVIGYDGVAIIVGDGAGVAALTIEQVRDVFAGDISNWNEVGGNDATIVVYNRDDASGTRDAFDSLVMGDKDTKPGANIVASNGAMRTSVAGNAYGIGYVGLSFLDDSTNALDILVDGTPVTPNAENVASEDYPIFRNLILVTDGEPTGWAKAFLEWCMQPTAQKLVASEGFVPLYE